ncbi:MAG: hypothetical protein GY865_16785, partial [candidate division Zixibacteria bacterium]|nr:hypothetical protein [candidate division Zixibacteria bacterium]
AIREGFNTNPELVKLTERITKQAVVERYLQENVMGDITIDDNDVLNFYEANKETQYKDKDFESIKEQVYQDYQGQKSKQAFQAYVNKLAGVENVQIFEEKIK